MRAEIKWLHSPDIDDLEAFVPDDPKKFAFLLQVMIGPVNTIGEESFDLQVCTPRWLEEQHGTDHILLGRHLLIVFGYNFTRIKLFLEKQVRACEGPTWNDIAAKLARIGRWEFEDYEPVVEES